MPTTWGISSKDTPRKNAVTKGVSGTKVPPNPLSQPQNHSVIKVSEKIAKEQLRKQTRGLFQPFKRDGNPHTVKGGYLFPVGHKVPLILDRVTTQLFQRFDRVFKAKSKRKIVIGRN